MRQPGAPQNSSLDPGVKRGTGDEIKRTATSLHNEEERKLRALAGQWKTPPVPVYASISNDFEKG